MYVHANGTCASEEETGLNETKKNCNAQWMEHVWPTC